MSMMRGNQETLGCSALETKNIARRMENWLLIKLKVHIYNKRIFVAHLAYVGQCFCATIVNNSHVIGFINLETVLRSSVVIRFASAEIQNPIINFCNPWIVIAPSKFTLFALVSCADPPLVLWKTPIWC